MCSHSCNSSWNGTRCELRSSSWRTDLSPPCSHIAECIILARRDCTSTPPCRFHPSEASAHIMFPCNFASPSISTRLQIQPHSCPNLPYHPSPLEPFPGQVPRSSRPYLTSNPPPHESFLKSQYRGFDASLLTCRIVELSCYHGRRGEHLVYAGDIVPLGTSMGGGDCPVCFGQ